MYLDPMYLDRSAVAGYSTDLEKAIKPPQRSPAVWIGVGVGALVARRRLVGAAVGGGIGLVVYFAAVSALRAAARKADAATAGPVLATAPPAGIYSSGAR